MLLDSLGEFEKEHIQDIACWRIKEEFAVLGKFVFSPIPVANKDIFATTWANKVFDAYR